MRDPSLYELTPTALQSLATHEGSRRGRRKEVLAHSYKAKVIFSSGDAALMKLMTRPRNDPLSRLILPFHKCVLSCATLTVFDSVLSRFKATAI